MGSTHGVKTPITPDEPDDSTPVMWWKGLGCMPGVGLSSASGWGVDYWAILPESIYDKSQYANNRAEQSHESTRVRERGMRKFKSVGQAQRFLGVHAAVSNLFNLERPLIRAEHYRNLREGAFAEWGRAVA